MNQIVIQLLQQKSNNFTQFPLLIGLQGMQGVGKSTLGQQLQVYFKEKGISFTSVSIDDFYLPFDERQKLDKQYYKYRGPPGTHSVDLMKQFFQQFKQGIECEIPIFNKALHNGHGDRVGIRKVKSDIVMFEGWLVGYVKVDNPAVDRELPNKRQFDNQLSEYMNSKLGVYEELWSYFDCTISIKPINPELSLKWRLQAEIEMRKEHGSGLSDEEVIDFVSYFWNCIYPRDQKYYLIKNKLMKPQSDSLFFQASLYVAELCEPIDYLDYLEEPKIEEREAKYSQELSSGSTDKKMLNYKIQRIAPIPKSKESIEAAIQHSQRKAKEWTIKHLKVKPSFESGSSGEYKMAIITTQSDKFNYKRLEQIKKDYGFTNKKRVIKAKIQSDDLGIQQQIIMPLFDIQQRLRLAQIY